MIATLAWKDYREHRAVWLATAFLSVGLVVGLRLAAPLSFAQGDAWWATVLFLTFVVAAGYGAVCGAILLADEREVGTLAFFDALAGRREPLWRTKFLTGLALVACQAVLLGAVSFFVLFPAGRPGGFLGWLGLVLLQAVEAYVWGLFFSAVCGSVLTAAGWSVLKVGLLWGILLAASTLDVWYFLTYAGVRAAVDLGALAASRRVFCHNDDRRAPRRLRLKEARPLSTLWLVWRQGRWLVGTLAVLGFLSLALPLSPLLLWPLFSLLAGVACGTAVFAGEQAGGYQRFLGDQRLAPGRLWWGKTGSWLAALAILSGLFLVGMLGRLAATNNLWEFGIRHTLLGLNLDYRSSAAFNPVTYFLLWPVYGFAVAQLVTLLPRKPAVAVVVALPLSVLAAVVWAPSLLAGGLAWWQVVVVPVILLITGRLAVWPWATGRLGTRGPVLALTGAIIACVAWVAGCLWVRVAEIPYAGPAFDVAAYEASYPTPEQNEAGRLIRQGAVELQAILDIDPRNKQDGPSSRWGQVNYVNVNGWPTTTDLNRRFWESTFQSGKRAVKSLILKWLDEPQPEDYLPEAEPAEPADVRELGRWLDELFSEPWVEKYREAARLPLGVVEDTRAGTINTTLPYLDSSRKVVQLLAARARQLQARGDHAAALELLGVGLGLSRQLLNHGPILVHLSGLSFEGFTLRAYNDWLDNLGPQPKLLARALEILKRHEAEVPPLGNAVKDEYLIARNTLEQFPTWHAERQQDQDSLRTELIATAWQAPWEQERRRRLLDTLYANYLWAAERQGLERVALLRELVRPESSVPSHPDRPFQPLFLRGLNMPGNPGAAELPRLEDLLKNALLLADLVPSPRVFLGPPSAEAQRQAAHLRTALALYEVEQGRPAARLEDLVPRYLPAVPIDPFSGHPFGYRVSKGEIILRAPQGQALPVFDREVAAGQGVFWSVGLDGAQRGDAGDDPNLAVRTSTLQPSGVELIFLTPRWAKPAGKR